MKKMSLLLGSLCALLVLSPLSAQAESRLQKILGEGVLRVGTTGDFNPMSFKDTKTKKYKGFDIDLVTKFAADMNVELKFVPTDWKTLVNGILADKYDMSTSASITPARAKVAGYSDPYIMFGTVAVTLKKNAFKYDSWRGIDTEETVIAVTLGTSFETQATDFFKKATIKRVESPAREYQEVLAGRADVSLTSNIEAANLSQTYRELRVIKTNTPLVSTPGAFLVDQSDQAWINYINHWIRIQNANGFLKTLYAKWFNASN